MTATRNQIEDTILAAWNYANWCMAGCHPPHAHDRLNATWIRGYALGFLGRDDYDRLRARLTKWPAIWEHEQPEPPPRVTCPDLEELVR